MFRDPLSGDSENMMTPARRARIIARLDAERRMREQRRLTAHLRTHGALPVDHPAHHRACSADCWNLAGILFADGAVHLFDREDTLHYEYALDARGTRNIESGASTGEDGWAFYVDEDGGLDTYHVPEAFAPAVQDVITALLSR